MNDASHPHHHEPGHDVHSEPAAVAPDGTDLHLSDTSANPAACAWKLPYMRDQ